MRRILIVIPASLKDQANTKSKEVDTVGGERTFTVGLSSTGNEPPSHYWCSWACTQAVWDQIKARLDTQTMRNAGVKVYDGDTTTSEQALSTQGLQRIGAVI